MEKDHLADALLFLKSALEQCADTGKPDVYCIHRAMEEIEAEQRKRVKWFDVIWNCIKTWDINVPGEYVGYCGAIGSHVRAILDALK